MYFVLKNTFVAKYISFSRDLIKPRTNLENFIATREKVILKLLLSQLNYDQKDTSAPSQSHTKISE